jgi:hypothetical protein
MTAGSMTASSTPGMLALRVGRPSPSLVERSIITLAATPRQWVIRIRRISVWTKGGRDRQPDVDKSGDLGRRSSWSRNEIESRD